MPVRPSLLPHHHSPSSLTMLITSPLLNVRSLATVDEYIYSATHVSTMSHRLVVMATIIRNNVQRHACLYNVTQTRCHGNQHPQQCTVPRTSLQCHTDSLSWQPASATTYSATHVSTMSHRLVVMTTSIRNNVQCHARLYNVTQTRCHGNQHPQQYTSTHFTLQTALDYKSQSDYLIELVLRPTRHKTGHFGDVLPSQSLGLVLKRLT